MFARLFNRGERRSSSLENPAVALSSAAALEIFGVTMSASGTVVSHHNADRVPAFWCGVNFIAASVASLPVGVFEGPREARVPVTTDLNNTLDLVINDELMTSFYWRQIMLCSVLSRGRHYTFIERNRRGDVINLWPLLYDSMTVERVAGRKRYRYNDAGRTIIYDPAEIIDVAWKLKDDGICHVDPIAKLADTLGLALDGQTYSSQFFANGGVPPLALEGTAASPAAITRAQTDMAAAIKAAHKDKRHVLYLPTGHKLTPVGFDPEKGQLLGSRQYAVIEIARILGLPPIFLMDLTNGTLANTSQADLFVGKHCIAHWADRIEAEISVKIGGRRPTQFVEFDLDGVYRGDLRTRMEALARAIQTGQLKPNEARRLENRPPAEGGDRLFIQGATVPLTMAGQVQAQPQPAPEPEPVGEPVGPAED
jgi:HK97 family phage portal protein